jgi:aspartyl-tRNA(Asn)/glutamyl-tRNA(Gln) amidotransferase subunit A
MIAVEEQLQHIAMVNPAINAVVDLDAGQVRRDAAVLDASGRHLPLYGLSYTVKDNIWVERRRITQGSPLFSDFIAPRDASSVALLRAAGALLLGISNCAEFACMGVTRNKVYGPTRHPLDHALTPGGSSGGAAAALAAGIGDFALCTDAGGSTRRPAAHCGLIGFKPSGGRIPHAHGFAEPIFANGVIGILTRDMAVMRRVFAVLGVQDGADAYSVPGLSRPAKGRRIAFSPTLGMNWPVEPVVAAGLEQAVAKLQAAGFEIVRRDPTWPEDSGEAGLMPLQHVGLAALYGEAYAREPDRFDPNIAAQIEAGLKYDGPALGRALLLREQLMLKLAAFFQEVDWLICPTVPCAPWGFDQIGPETIAGQPVGPRGHAVFTPLFNHALVPAISLPCGKDAAGLPFGLQLVGPRLQDEALLDLAAEIVAVLAKE